jgi:hypothetical protein
VLKKSDSRRNHVLLFVFSHNLHYKVPKAGIPNSTRLVFCHFTMDDITQQMNAVTLLGNANKKDDDDFNARLFKYLLFVASNAGKETIVWFEADQELKTWMTQNRLQLMASQPSERVKVLNHVNFPWTWSLHQEKWNQHYEELVEFHNANGHCNVRWACCLGQWVNNQRRSKKNGKLSANRIELLDGLGFEWSRVRIESYFNSPPTPSAIR